MDPETIQKFIHDGIAKALQEQLPTAVQTAVDTAVNGKIKALDAKVTPMVEAYDKWLSARRVAIIVIGFFIALGSFIQSAQAVWSVVSAHFSVK